MKSILLLSSLTTIFLASCSLSNDTASTNEFNDYEAITFTRLGQPSQEIENRDLYMINVYFDEERILLISDDHNEDEEAAMEDDGLGEEDTLVSITLEDNVFYIEGEDNEFTFTAISQSSYELDTGGRYQPRAVQNGFPIEENPFYEED